MVGQMQRNPQQIAQQMTQQAIKNNPLFKRAEQMAQGKSNDELEQVARNLCKQSGINFEEALNMFKGNINNLRY